MQQELLVEGSELQLAEQQKYASCDALRPALHSTRASDSQD
jgi:hypothetical protein